SRRTIIALVVFLVVALIHEFAHVLTLHRFGGRVREMGLTTVAFCPCFYCDITDSYLLPHKYQRIAVALAGPFAQAVAGALASMWLFLARPENAPLRFARASTSLVVLLSIANLFPFARTDGYYILTELLGLPNLRRQARRQLSRWWTGDPGERGTTRRLTWPLWLYGVPSAAFAVWMATRLLQLLARPWLPGFAGLVIAASTPLIAGPVKGQLVDQQGRALAGAVITAVDTMTGRDAASAMSDAQGQFALNLPADWPPMDIHATAAGT